MFLINAQFRPSRSKRDTEKDGVVFYRITEQTGENGSPSYRSVNSDIHGADPGVLKTKKDDILYQLRLLYCIIESRADSKEPFSIDDVAEDFRKALSGDESMGGAIAKSKTDFPLRRDLVSVGRDFKGSFRFVFSERRNAGDGNAYNYMFNLIQSLKNENRTSLAKNFNSLLASLKSFADGKELFFHEIDRKFVLRYAEWLKLTGISDSTQSFYLRNLRAVLNKARDGGLIDSTDGWFQNVNLSIARSTPANDGKLNRDLLLKIESLDLSDNKPAALIRDIFMFGFYCGGMELVDIANLVHANVREGVLIYRRRLKGLERRVVLGRQAMKIIERYEGRADKYLFPLSSLSKNALFETIRSYVCQLLKVIGKAVGYPKLSFNMNITAYKLMMSETSVPELLLKRE